MVKVPWGDCDNNTAYTKTWSALDWTQENTDWTPSKVTVSIHKHVFSLGGLNLYKFPCNAYCHTSSWMDGWMDKLYYVVKSSSKATRASLIGDITITKVFFSAAVLTKWTSKLQLTN